MFTRIMLGVLTAVMVTAFPAFSNERSGTVTYEIRLQAPQDASDVRLWLPVPQSDENQKITDVSVTGDFSSKIETKARDGNHALVVDWKGRRSERKLVFSFTETRREVIARNFPKTEGPMPDDLKPYLELNLPESSSQRVKELAAEITGGRKTVLEKARAIYDWVVENMRRDPEVKGCGLCEVEHLLAVKGGKCADIHAVFVALARASGVPARKIYGIRMPTEKSGDITKYQHCWAEFFLPGYGWVVVDPADVLKFKLKKNPTPQELKAKAEYFFGAVDANRVQLSMGDHVLLNPAPQAGELLYFMYPYAEADGKPLCEDLFCFNMGYKILFHER